MTQGRLNGHADVSVQKSLIVEIVPYYNKQRKFLVMRSFLLAEQQFVIQELS